MNEKYIYILLRKFILKVFENYGDDFGIAEEQIRPANQNKNIPKKPFIILEIGDFKDLGKYIDKVFENEQITYICAKTCKAKIEAFSDKALEAETILACIYDYIKQTNIDSEIFNGDLSVVRTSQRITPVPKMMNFEMESRAYFTVELCFNKEVIEKNVTTIDSIELRINDNNIII